MRIGAPSNGRAGCRVWRMRTLRRCRPLLLLAFLACGSEQNLPGPLAPLPASARQAAAGLAAPLETWTYVDVPESRCANGTSTGFAVNVSQRSSRVLLFLEGGGACWDYYTCAVKKSARHLEDTVGAAQVLADAQQVAFVFDRHNPANPFADATFVYVPYCTGDAHAGNNLAHYSRNGGMASIEHRGAANLDAFLSRVVPAFPSPQRVWLMGVSAGGHGAMLNWQRVQDAFGSQTRVDVFSDSGTPIDLEPTRYAAMRAAWKLKTPMGCVGCEKNLGGLAEALALELPPPHRLAFATFRHDDFIAGNAPPHGFGGMDYATYEARIDALRAQAGPGQRTYYAAGEDHILIGKIGWTVGPSFPAWLRSFATDDPQWAHVDAP